MTRCGHRLQVAELKEAEGTVDQEVAEEILALRLPPHPSMHA